ncbi:MULTISPECIES: TerC family protein [Thermus]|uniref:TerC family protein n=1 Tax=Thermus antranikianii TaxID=88190 RepID=A0ABY7RRH1_9DEIN|nr:MULTISPECIES: TerC family protein [Thermus]QWK21199.1 MAG: TerC family protein [Thermus antranikianii]WCM39968.1 TerC family protein [Thermus antranikianii]
MDWLTNPEVWVALITLTVLEVVLGIDNVIFISILASKLPKGQQDRARMLGLSMAALTRILFLLSIAWIMALKKPLFALLGHEVTGKDLVLIAGGLFLIYKSVKEIHEKLEGEPGHAVKRVAPSFASVIGQVLLLDIVFSIDSVITAVGLTRFIPVMVAAILLSVAIMLLASKGIYAFVNQHPTVKMLALSFLLLVGFTLVAEGMGVHIPKGYVYFAMGFAVLVEWLNLRAGLRGKPVKLHEPYEEEA